MKVRLLESRAGVGFSQLAGEVIEVDKEEALSLLNAGQAEAVTSGRRSSAAGADVETR